MTTVRDLLLEGKLRLADFDAARLEAEILLADAMDASRVHLFAHPEQEIPKRTAEQFRAAINKRQRGEPIAYLTGQKEFWSLPLKVTPAVLIPRPETEILVETALAKIPKDSAWRIADIGTGSGAIAIALAHERPQCEIHATDISMAALEIARENAEKFGLANIRFHAGSWLDPLSGRFDLIVSNPPYLAAHDTHLHEGDLPFEPDGALIAGSDGLEAIDTLCRAAANYLRAGGWLGLEHGHDQAGACKAIMASAGFTGIEQFRDLQQITRVTSGLRP